LEWQNKPNIQQARILTDRLPIDEVIQHESTGLALPYF